MLLLLQQYLSLLGDCLIMLDRFVIIIVELLDGCLIARPAHGAVDERVRFPGCFDRFASGLVVDGEETRLPPVIGFGSIH